MIEQMPNTPLTSEQTTQEQNRRLYWALCTVTFAMILTLLRSISLPNDWALAHWLLGYQFGFAKRGLPGAILSSLGLIETEARAVVSINIIASVVMLVMLLSLVWVWSRVYRLSGNHRDVLLFGVVFMTSPFIVMTGQLNGYYDHIFQLGAIVVVAAVLRRAYVLAAVLQVLIMLVHETYLIIGFPAVFIALVLQFSAEVRHPYLWDRLLVIVSPLVIMGFLALLQTQLDADARYTAIQAYLAGFPVIAPQYTDFFIPFSMTTSFQQFWVNESPRFWERIGHVGFWVMVSPTIVFGLYTLYTQYGRQLSLWVHGLILGAVFVPLALHLIAWDTARIWQYPIFVLWVVCWVVAEHFPARGVPPSRVGWLLFGAALLVNSQANMTIFDVVIDLGAWQSIILLLTVMTLTLWAVYQPAARHQVLYSPMPEEEAANPD